MTKSRQRVVIEPRVSKLRLDFTEDERRHLTRARDTAAESVAWAESRLASARAASTAPDTPSPELVAHEAEVAREHAAIDEKITARVGALGARLEGTERVNRLLTYRALGEDPSLDGPRRDAFAALTRELIPAHNAAVRARDDTSGELRAAAETLDARGRALLAETPAARVAAAAEPFVGRDLTGSTLRQLYGRAAFLDTVLRSKHEMEATRRRQSRADGARDVVTMTELLRSRRAVLAEREAALAAAGPRAEWTETTYR